ARELRPPMRMNGSGQRYRPGERWRRPEARARLVIEVPGAVAVCFDAPVVELFAQRAEALHTAPPRRSPASGRISWTPRSARTAPTRRSAASAILPGHR